MSSPEVERFEVTDEDLANEFNPNRPTYRQSKNKAIYGKPYIPLCQFECYNKIDLDLVVIIIETSSSISL